VASEPYSEPALQPGSVPATEPGSPSAPGGAEIEGRSPWYLAYRRLRRNKVALSFLALFILVVLFCLAAPWWAHNVAHTDPDQEHLTEKITVNGQKKDVVDPTGIPIGPQYFAAGGKFFLGADQNGRDVMVRLMYGGRVSLFVGVMAAIVTTLLAVALGLIAGYNRGWADSVISRAMDVVWAFPVLLLGIALGTALAAGGLKIGPLSVPDDSLWIPILIIGFVYTPYMARPIRGEVLALREKEFVEASIAQGAGPLRIMFGELLPNLWSTIIVFFTLNIANNMLLESALSFLGAGVRPPQSSWGSMTADGYEVIYSAPHLVLLPGLMIILTVLSLNVFGDGLRDALDPRAKIRLEQRSGVAEPEEAAAGWEV
jgi:peptide/nickel transport system permease protein